MKNLKYVFIFFAIVLIIGISIFLFIKNNSDSKKVSENNNTTEISRTSTESNDINQVSNTVNENSTKEQNVNNTGNLDPTAPKPQPEVHHTPIEEDISSFSTRIYTTKDSARQKNLEITSSKLNGTTVEPGKTFSFTSTVGKATPEEGYEKADIYDENGNKVKGYGGGNCQISSTLYNAVLKLPSLNVTERHPHAKKVPYVEEDKDAAVAYGSVDFKFVNNYDYSIKIYCSVDKKNVYVRIVKLS